MSERAVGYVRKFMRRGTTMSKGPAIHFSFDPAEFAGKRALVTGGTKGMGEAIVRRLAAGGATVATTARSPLPESQAVKLFVQADISTRAGVDDVVREVMDRFGGVDILVNNVGGSSAPSGGVLALSDDDWQDTINANLFAAVRLDRAFLPAIVSVMAQCVAAPSILTTSPAIVA